MEAPQFPTKDDLGHGDGISPIPQWQLVSTDIDPQDRIPDDLNIHPDMGNILFRLRTILHRSWHSSLTNTQLHDLTCFVMHRLLLLPPFTDADPIHSADSECFRYATALYMLIIHGTTYYSHMSLANTIALQLKGHLLTLTITDYIHNPHSIWVLSVGMIATIGTEHHQWFIDQTCAAAAALGLSKWEAVLPHLQSVLWVRGPQEQHFRQMWEQIFRAVAK